LSVFIVDDGLLLLLFVLLWLANVAIINGYVLLLCQYSVLAGVSQPMAAKLSNGQP